MKEKCIQCGKEIDETDPRVIFIVRLEEPKGEDGGFLCGWWCQKKMRRIENEKAI